MTYRRAVIMLGVLLAMVLVWMVLTVLPAHQLLSDAERRPTPACQGYNTHDFAFRVSQLKAKQTDADAERTDKKDAGADPDVVIATLEATCQANAISRASVQVNNVILLVAVVAGAVSIFALVFPVIVGELGGGGGGSRRRAAELTVNVSYGDGTTAGSWTMSNRGGGPAFVHGVSVVPYPAGGSAAAIAAAATFSGSGSEVAAGNTRPIAWTGASFVGDAIVAVRHSDGVGGRGVAWARFALQGSPARQEKQEEGYLAEP